MAGPAADRDDDRDGDADEVDRLVAAWSRERPDLDASPLQVLSRVSRLAHHLDRARGEAFAATGLVLWEFDVLAALRRAGAPHELSPSALAAATLVTSGTMTTRLDRLSARGLVERRPRPDDRRGVIVRLTGDGLGRVDEALADLLVRERDLLGVLGAGEGGELAGLLRRLLAAFESSRSGGRAGGGASPGRRRGADPRSSTIMAGPAASGQEGRPA